MGPFARKAAAIAARWHRCRGGMNEPPWANGSSSLFARRCFPPSLHHLISSSPSSSTWFCPGVSGLLTSSSVSSARAAAAAGPSPKSGSAMWSWDGGRCGPILLLLLMRRYLAMDAVAAATFPLLSEDLSADLSGGHPAEGDASRGTSSQPQPIGTNASCFLPLPSTAAMATEEEEEEERGKKDEEAEKEEVEEEEDDVIDAKLRSGAGKNLVKKLRRRGLIPSIVFEQEGAEHGGNKELIAVDTKLIQRLLKRHGLSLFMSRTYDLRITRETVPSMSLIAEGGSLPAETAETEAAAVTVERVLPKLAKLKIIAEEQAAKKKKLEEEMRRVQQEEEEKMRAAIEEEEIEEEEQLEEEEQTLERRRMGERGEGSNTKEDDPWMEKKISEWVANLSLGEDEEAMLYVPQEEKEAAAREIEAASDSPGMPDHRK
ncbi:hypothetical protein CBR_g4269 [Chara braunii]|uniref:Large ribosomal subunit protein bL25 L25 domain-containing protein n=1 Tax=Chara braunii TaxID=69332 RepID=A0A388JRB4_CHABU|nr:hypothetical protein CBR_g4269 [Chara braunii]|eukprot:GBG60313.1 hypothetical protein CBR_g4269 [Chara braunii]